MIEDFLELKLPPGFFGNGTKYQAMGRWRNGNLARFHEGTIQPIGGWRLLPLTGATIQGTAQAVVSWQIEDGTPFLAVGTTLGLYVIDANNVVYDITPAVIQASPYNWQLSTYGTYLIAVNSLLGDQDISVINTFYWTGNTAALALPTWTTAQGPRGVYATFTTPERFLVCLRGEDPTAFPARGGIGTAYSEHRVYWPSQEELTDFLASDINTAGDFDLQTKGRLMAGAAARGESILFTDLDAWKMVYIGGELIYSFQKAGDNCGAVSKQGHVVLDQGVFWMGRGKFFLYDGFVKSIPCEVTDTVFGDFNEQAAYTVWATTNPRYNEVTWFYPAAGSTSPDRYVTYNYAENHWVTGRLTRCAGVPQRFTGDIIDEPLPVWFDGAQLYEHESGQERESAAYLESGPIQLGSGDRLMRLQGIVPDDTNVGDVQLRVYTAMSSDDTEALHGPYTLAAQTAVRKTARHIRVRLEEVNATSWRVGHIRLGVRAVERRGAGAGTPADLTPVTIEIFPTAVTLINAQRYTFGSVIRNAAGQVLDREPDFWTSDNSADVPVNSSGTVSALASPATAHIQAGLTTPAILSNIATVTVTADNTPVRIVVTPDTASILPDGTVQLTAKVYNAAGQELIDYPIDSWDSDTPANATVDGAGLVTGVAAGTANVTASIALPPLTSNASVITVVSDITVVEAPSGTTVDGPVLLIAVGGGAGGGNYGGGGGGAVQTLAYTGAASVLTIAVGAGGGAGVAGGQTTVDDSGGNLLNPGGGNIGGGGNAGACGDALFTGGSVASAGGGDGSASAQGGGGGAGAAGANGAASLFDPDGSGSHVTGEGAAGAGGDGELIIYLGTIIGQFGGGGGGGGTTTGTGTCTPGAGGVGGGGVGVINGAGGNAVPGTGGGGGGGTSGGAGSNGVVLIAYRPADATVTLP